MTRLMLLVLPRRILAPTLALAQDKVLYREKGAKSGIQTSSGRIEAETIGGIKIRLADDPQRRHRRRPVRSARALIKLDYPKAVAAESGNRQAAGDRQGIRKDCSRALHF